MEQGAWRQRLTAEVAREDIPTFLAELQGLVAALRRFRDDLSIPTTVELVPYVTPLLAAHPTLVVAYVSDSRYHDVVRGALEAA